MVVHQIIAKIYMYRSLSVFPHQRRPAAPGAPGAPEISNINYYSLI